MLSIPDNDLWIVIVGFIISFILAFAIGANDVANAFGTSVGSKVLSLRWACILGTVFETTGAVLLGKKVAGTIKDGIVYTQMYEDDPSLLMVGQLSSLAGCAIWLIIATFFKLPVSTTHSIVGATVGFTLVARGPSSVRWSKIGMIAASWVTSPILSGIVSLLLFYVCHRFIIASSNPLEYGTKALPFIYGATVGVNAFSIILSAPELLYFHKIPLWGNFIASIGLAFLIGLLVRFVAAPRLKSKILSLPSPVHTVSAETRVTPAVKTSDLNFNPVRVELGGHKDKQEIENYGYTNGAFVANNNGGCPDTIVTSGLSNAAKKKKTDEDKKRQKLAERSDVSDSPEVFSLFSFLQTLTACFNSFTHGGNDVANAIGPIIGIWILASSGDIFSKMETPIWILLFGGAGISIGLWILGRRVIETIGEDLTKVTPSSGFSTEFGAALTVLIASNIGIPISTTHCIVGSVVCVGRFRSRANVDWKIFTNVIISWLLTLPTAGGITALITLGLMQIPRS